MAHQAERPRILILTDLHPSAVDRLRHVAAVDLRRGLSEQELEAIIGGYEALIVDSERRVPDRTIEYGYRLQVIGVAGGSLDLINVSAARSVGVQVVNVPDPLTLALAEQTMGLMLALAHRRRAVGLAGKTLGVVGFGSVGHLVAHRARAFDMRVLVHQPRLTPELALEAGVTLRELHRLLEESDYVSLHLPTSPETRYLIGREELGHMRPGAFLINTGSVQSLDVQAALEALDEGRLAGAALIVPEAERRTLPESHPNLLVSPRLEPQHTGIDRSAALNLAEHVLECLKRHLAGNPLSLRVVPLERVLPHEHFDPLRVADLAARLQQETTLVNPPVVVQHKDAYVVLDGATRVTAFKQLGYPHIVVQLIDPRAGTLELHTWYHAVHGISTDELLDHLNRLAQCRIMPAPRDSLQPALDAGEAIASLLTPEGEGYLVRHQDAEPLDALNALVKSYAGMGQITRTLNTDPALLRTEVPGMAALVIFPQFTLEEVLEAAVAGRLFPAGITRFVIPGRVLRLHADLDRLRAQESLEQKNAWLNELLAEKLARRGVRYYQEPVVLLDE